MHSQAGRTRRLNNPEYPTKNGFTTNHTVRIAHRRHHDLTNSVFMNKNYNYQRRPLLIPEYGRHIQEMIDSLLEIEDRAERTRQAKAVIAVMGNLNPTLRDTAEFTHKLWDHLFIMSDFKLDVDSPYSKPTREDLEVKPEPLAYSQGGITHKHYGKHIGNILKRISAEPNRSIIGDELDNVTRFMRAKSVEFNQEFPSNDVLIKDIRYMTNDGIIVDEEYIKKIEAEHKSALAQQRNAKHSRNGATAKARQKNNQKRNTKR